MSHVDEEALDWFVRRADGLAADDARFLHWLAADPDHARAYARWQQEWRELDALPADAVKRLKNGLGPAPPAAATTPRIPAGTLWQRRFAAWSAAWRLPRAIVAGTGLALLLACGLTGMLWWQPVVTSSHVTARDERIDTILADGSRLQLASASRAVASLFRTRREIALSRGHARFEIKTDPARPLTVLAGDLRITVVGTRFTVHHGTGPHGNGVRIAVEEGRVRVARNGWFTPFDETVDLVAGQAIGSAAEGGLEKVSAVLPADLAPWHERRVSFENATLAQVLAEFARYGDTRLIVRDPPVAAMRLTGTFDLLRPDLFAQLLPRALPVRLANAGGHIEIRAR